MKLRLETFFRFYLFVCIMLLGWAFWAEAAQTNSVVRLSQPKDGTTFTKGTNITLTADFDVMPQNVARIDYLRDGKILGTATNAPYSVIWSNIPGGNYVLSASLVNNAGETYATSPIKVRILAVDSYLTFGLDKIDLLTYDGLFGLPLWQYLASFIYIFLAFYISKFLDFLTRVWLKKWAEKTDTKFDDILLELVNGPVKIIAFVIFLHIGLNVFSWPDWVEGFLAKVLRVVVAVTITHMLLKGVDMLMVHWKERNSLHKDKTFDEQLFPIVSKSLKLFIVVVAVLVTWQYLSDKPITAILASLSIGGLAIGLAAQDTIANFFGAVVVFVDKPFQVGDRIKLPDVDGTVETIGLRSTRVRNVEGFLITVPNKTMGNATITNISRRSNIKAEINLGLTYDTTAEQLGRALTILDEIFRKHPMTHDLQIAFNRFGDSALNIQIVHWWKSTNAREQVAGIQELNLEIKKRFDAEKINFAFPTQTLYVKQDSDWKVQAENKQS